MSNLSCSKSRYARFENTRWGLNHHAGSTHAILNQSIERHRSPCTVYRLSSREGIATTRLVMRMSIMQNQCSSYIICAKKPRLHLRTRWLELNLQIRYKLSKSPTVSNAYDRIARQVEGSGENTTMVHRSRSRTECIVCKMCKAVLGAMEVELAVSWGIHSCPEYLEYRQLQLRY